MIMHYCTLYLDAVSSYNSSGVLIAIDDLNTGAAVVLPSSGSLSMLPDLFPLIGNKDLTIRERRLIGCHFPNTAILSQ